MKTIIICLLILVTFNMHAQKMSIKLSAKATLILERAPFYAAGKALKYHQSAEPTYGKMLVAINDKPIFGSDGEIPGYILKGATLLLDGHQYSLPVDNMYNPWLGNNSIAGNHKLFFKLLPTRSGYKLQGLFADDIGFYAVEWVLTGKIVKRTILTSNEDQIAAHFSAVMPQ